MEASTPAAANDAESDPNIVTWDGPNDPANPMNWTTRKKVAAVGIVSFITLLSLVATLTHRESSLYQIDPSLPQSLRPRPQK